MTATIRPPDASIAAEQLTLIEAPAPNAETVVLALCAAILGDGLKDHGLMTRTHQGARHMTRCTVGYYVQAGDSQRGGAPCGGRCLVLREAVALAAAWLWEQEQERQQQAPALGAVGRAS